MKNVKFRGIMLQKRRIPWLNSVVKPKFCGSARNSVVHGKLWSLHIVDCV